MPIGRSGNAFNANSTRSGTQVESAITTLADGRFAMVWRSGDSGVNDQIRMRIYNADGTPFGKDMVVATGKVDLPEITGLPDGGIAVAWSVIDSPTTSAVRFRLFGADGEAMGGGVNVVRSSTPTHSQPVLSATPDGFIAGTAKSGVLNTYSSDGQRLAVSTGSIAGEGTVIELSSGISLVISADGSEIRRQMFRDGAPLGLPSVLDQGAATGADSAPAAAVLSDGSLVIAWNDSLLGPQARIIGLGGTMSVDLTGFARPPQIAALPDGRFMLVWQGMVGGSPGEVLAQIFNADGTSSAPPIVVGDALAAAEAAPTVAVLPDGKVVVTWTIDDGDGLASGLTNGADIRTQILDPTKFVGTTGVDIYSGGALRDIITGNSGDDVFHGNGGNDSISGDGGNDTLFGDEGNDSLFGGSGADTLDGGDGDDYLSGGSGDDVLIGGLGVDRLFGGGGNDRIIVDELAISAVGGGEVLDGGTGTGDVIAISGSGVDFRSHTLAGIEIIETTGFVNIFGRQMTGVTQLRGDGAFLITMQAGQNVLDLSGLDTSGFAPTANLSITGALNQNAVITGSDFGENIAPLFGNDIVFARGGDDTVTLLTTDHLGKTLDGGDGVDTLRIGGSDGYAMDFVGLSVTGFEKVLTQSISAGDFTGPNVGSVRLAVGQIAGHGGDISSISGFSGDTLRTSLLELVMGTATSFDMSTSLTVTGYNGPNDRVTIVGDADFELIIGSDGDEVIDSGAGNDLLIGRGGDDTYVLTGSGTSISEAADGGSDTIRSLESRDLRNFNNIENLTLNSDSIVPVTGTGTDGANVLDGIQGLGIANFFGLGGDDIYILGAGDTATETLAGAAGGVDTVKTTVNHTLGDNFENLTFLFVTGNRTGTGNALNNVLDASQSSFAQTLDGLGGDDTYIVGEGDVVIESIAGAAGGIDTILSSVTRTLGDNVENLVLTGNAIISGTGNALNNVLDGAQNNGQNTLRGLGGDDTYIVNNNDTVIEAEGEGIDVIRTAFARTLSLNVENLVLTGSAAVAGTGNALANVLDGSQNSAANTLTGLLGNDTYILGAGDIADETGGGAGDVDLIMTSSTLSLSDATRVIGAIENLTLTGTSAINGIGNSLANVLTGNSAGNILQGLGGSDTLDGGAGVDTADYSEKTAAVSLTLAGSTAATVKVGGADEDTVRNIENVIGGSGGDVLTGDSLANLLVGNDGGDKLSGAGGNDVLRGGAGTDTLDGGTGSDTADYSDKAVSVSVTLNGSTVASVFVDGIKEDTVVNIENVIGGGAADTLIGDSLSNSLTGGKGNDTLSGNGGADQLIGGAGRDVLTGGAGNDIFVFSSTSDSGITSSTQDIITDFTKGADRIDLRGIDAMTVGNLTNDAFLSTLIQGTASTSFNGVQGQIIWFQVDNVDDSLDRTIIRLNTDTDNTAEMHIELFGLQTLSASDFLL